ncbi:o-succinylbenzoate synthase [Natronospirillum operosum]|uniref:o-succinylbenzoate synthase n=1 Tax=Natronospirillum operosum TaxID=2759953 RepID=A0A4Z0WG68_9GAMM|nr:o-succinylbenzoate synthase [Natronospirillum operosum]TGG93568.1 o-succinylbenzoate synthase [Natronospirillum operosum]
MIIDQIDVYHLRMPMVAPWVTAFGTQTAIDSVMVRMQSQGLVGWGESAPYERPEFSPEWAEGAAGLLRAQLAPALTGEDITSGNDLQARLQHFKGNYFAKAALDNAWWDLAAKQVGQPLWQWLGGREQSVAVGADIPVLADTNALLAAVDSAVQAGFERVKLKFRRDSGIERLLKVRETFPDLIFHVDCNSGFTLADLPLFQQLDSLNLAMIEQPLAFDDLVDHARLQERLTTPLCLDESLVSPRSASQAIALGACGWFNLKPGRVGGLTNALAIYELAQAANIPCWVGGMLESAVGQGTALALAASREMSYPADIFPSDRLYANDLASPSITLSGRARIDAPLAPGHGFTPLPEQLARCKV